MLLQRYKSFDLHIVLRGTSRFGFEIWNRGGRLLSSVDSFYSADEALSAGCRFVDDVDRRVGLAPIKA